MKVLIVDDDPKLDAIIESLPSDCRITVTCRYQGALELLGAERFDALLAPLHLPMANGLMQEYDNQDVANGFLLALLAIARGVKHIALIAEDDGNELGGNELGDDLKLLLEKHPEHERGFDLNGTHLVLRLIPHIGRGRKDWRAAFNLLSHE